MHNVTQMLVELHLKSLTTGKWPSGSFGVIRNGMNDRLRDPSYLWCVVITCLFCTISAADVACFTSLCVLWSGVAELFDSVSSRCGVLHMSCSMSLLTAYMTDALRRLQRSSCSGGGVVWRAVPVGRSMLLMSDCWCWLPHAATDRLRANCSPQSAPFIMMQYCVPLFLHLDMFVYWWEWWVVVWLNEFCYVHTYICISSLGGSVVLCLIIWHLCTVAVKLRLVTYGHCCHNFMSFGWQCRCRNGTSSLRYWSNNAYINVSCIWWFTLSVYLSRRFLLNVLHLAFLAVSIMIS